MTEKKAANNYALFNKYLGKISKAQMQAGQLQQSQLLPQ